MCRPSGEKKEEAKKDDRWMNLRKINVHEKASYLLVLLLFIENLFAASQSFSKQELFRKYLF